MKKYTIFLVLILCMIFSSETTIKAKEITINKEKMTVYIGNKLSDTIEDLTWSSSNNKIATVNEDGVVIGKSKGNCTITAISGDNEFTCEVTVKSPYISPTKTSFKVGQKEKFTVKGVDKSTKITWKSSNKKIAKVDSKGNVTGVGTGKATITATVGKKEYIKSISISKPKVPKFLCYMVYTDTNTELFCINFDGLKGNDKILIFDDLFLYNYNTKTLSNKLQIVKEGSNKKLSLVTEFTATKDDSAVLLVDSDFDKMWIYYSIGVVFKFKYDGVVYSGMATTSLDGFSYWLYE